MIDKINEFGSLIQKMAQTNKSVSTIWAMVIKNNDDGTFDCKSISDGLEYFDVLPGLSALEIIPKKKRKCLIGIIDNSNDAFLIAAEEIEEMKINGDDFGGLAKAPEIKSQVDKNTDAIKKLQQIFNAWIPTPQDGGAALKGQITQFTGMPTADLSNIENEIVKHG